MSPARGGKLDEEIAFAVTLRLLLLRLVLELAPRVRWQVLETPGIPRVGGHGLRRVVVAQRDVIPLLGRQQLARQLGAAVFDRATFLAKPTVHAVGDEHVERGPPPAGFRTQRGTVGSSERLLRHREDRAVELGKNDPARCFDRDFDTEGFIETQDAPRLGGARRVVLARDHDDRRVGQTGPQPLEVAETVQDRGVGWPDRVKQVAGDDDQLRLLLQDVVDRTLEDLGDVHLPLIRALGRLPVELPEAQVQVGEVRELHCKRIVV